MASRNATCGSRTLRRELDGTELQHHGGKIKEPEDTTDVGPSLGSRQYSKDIFDAKGNAKENRNFDYCGPKNGRQIGYGANRVFNEAG